MSPSSFSWLRLHPPYFLRFIFRVVSLITAPFRLSLSSESGAVHLERPVDGAAQYLQPAGTKTHLCCQCQHFQHDHGGGEEGASARVIETVVNLFLTCFPAREQRLPPPRRITSVSSLLSSREEAFPRRVPADRSSAILIILLTVPHPIEISFPLSVL